MKLTHIAITVDHQGWGYGLCGTHSSSAISTFAALEMKTPTYALCPECLHEAKAIAVANALSKPP